VVDEPPDLPAGAFAIDPEFGRIVVVPGWSMREIRRDHGSFCQPHRAQILEAVAHADGNAPDTTRGRHRYRRDHVGGSRWLFVVVEYPLSAVGEVIPAFPRRRLPKAR